MTAGRRVTAKGEVFYSLKEVEVLTERWRIYYNTQRPHSSLGYRPPAPTAWHNEACQGQGKVESKQRFPLFHAPTVAAVRLSNPLRYTNSLAGTKHWAGQFVTLNRKIVQAR